MRTLRFKISGQGLIRASGCDPSNIIADISGYLQAAFEFRQGWDGTVQAAVFYPYSQSQEAGRLIKNDTCIVLDEVTAYDTSKIRVIGRRENGQGIITNLTTIEQERGSGQA